MRYVPMILLAVFALAFTAEGQADKKDPPKKSKGQLPAGWKKLDLSKDQLTKVYAVQTEYKAKIYDLKEKIKVLETDERQAMLALLTKEQKAILAKGLGIDPKPPEKK